MKNTSSAKNSKSGAPRGSRNMGGGSGGGGPRMPNVGGHTSNITPTQGVNGRKGDRC